MCSWKSALTCYEFFRKRHLPIADEAIMSIYLRFYDQGDDSKVNIQFSSDMPNIFPFMGDEKMPKIKVNNLFLNDCNNFSCNDLSQKELNALKFFLHSTQYQPTLRPLYHRLRFILQSMSREEEFRSGVKRSVDSSSNDVQELQSVVSVALPVLSAPSSIINISLHHNLRKGRWIDALRTIHNIQQYGLLEPYLKELSKVQSWSGTSELLATVSQDVCYRACVEFPSLLSLMDTLIQQWETYWSAMKGSTMDRNLVGDKLLPSETSFSFTDILPDSSFTTPTSTSAALAPGAVVDSNDDGNRSVNIEGISDSVDKDSETKFSEMEATGNFFLRRSELEESSLEVLRFASFNTFFGVSENDMKVYEEQEVCHRLMEVTTRVADFSFCCRLADAWSISCNHNISGKSRVFIPSSVTKELLLTRLLLRAPSCEIILSILNRWPQFSSTTLMSHLKTDSIDNDIVVTTLRCPEVVSALAYRLTPSIFFEEIVEKYLQRSEILLCKEVRDIVRDTLKRGEFYDAAEKFCMRQTQLEMVALCHSNEIVHMRKSFGQLVEEYLSQQFSFCKKVQLFSDLFQHVKETEYVFIINALLNTVDKENIGNTCYTTVNSSRLSIIVQLICKWISEDHRPGDATVILYHVLNVIEDKNIELCGVEEENLKEKSLPSSLQNLFDIDDVVNPFFESVSRLGFLLGNVSPKEEKFTIALQWLKLLSMLPTKHFDETTIVVWLFWTMRAVVQYEEEEEKNRQEQQCLQIYTSNTKTIQTEVIKAVCNLSHSLEKCETTAILPPMLLNWLVSHADMPWGDATALLTRHAGIKTSQKQRFVFIRLPLGNAAFDTFTNPHIKKHVLLLLESELQSNKLSRSSTNWYLVFKEDLDLKKRVKHLFTAIRFTILNAWYYRILNTHFSIESNTDDVNGNSFVPYTTTISLRKQRSLGQVKRKVNHDNIIYSLHEALESLWKQNSFKKEKKYT